MPNGRWKRCGSDGWVCCAKPWAQRRSSCASTRPATARKATPPTRSPAKTSAICTRWPMGASGVNAYGVLGSTTFPLLFRVFKPATRLKAGDGYKTKPQLAIELIRAHLRSSRSCCAQAFASASSWPIVSTARAAPSSARYTVYACSMSWPSAPLTASMASGCCRMLPDAAGCCRVSASGAPTARPFDRVFTDGTSQERFIRETICGTRRTVRS
jgi:hypothetical protein